MTIHSNQRDAADAGVVWAVANGIGEWRAATGSAASNLKPLREVIWFYWHNPRLPRPRVAGKYPHASLWTPAAVAVAGQSAALRIEHVEPLNIVMGLLIAERTAGPDRTRELLQDGLECIVISADEDQRIDAAGLRDRMPMGWRSGDDRWARYRAAGIDPDTFAPFARV
jgi:hypothetical protein